MNEIEKIRADLAAKRRRRGIKLVEPEKTPPAGLKQGLAWPFGSTGKPIKVEVKHEDTLL